MSIYISEAFVNKDKDIRYWSGEPYETGLDKIGNLYRCMLKEHGRCIGKVYVDRENGETWAVGWVFIKREHYDDNKDTYIRETWITLYHQPIERQLLYRRLENKS